YSCSLCKYATDDKESLREHMSHHKNTSHTIRIYACSYCKKQSTSMDIIERHLSNQHPSEYNIVEWKCVLCGLQMFNESMMRRHVMCQHLKLKPFSCIYCNAHYWQKQTIENHVRHSHADQELHYHCQICGYRASRHDKAKYHIIKKHLKIGLYSCSLCKVKFAFNNHARVHRLHVCGYCGYKNRLVNKVQLHCTLKHPRQKFLYKCNLCEYSSDKVTVIRHHVMSHLLYHPYQCPYCDSAKSVKSSPITKHVNLKHPNEIVRQCGFCSFTCENDEEYDEHVNTHTKLKPIKCKYCLFASFTSSDMKRHFESKH
ncbi:hypothetical protein HELRODRAFT_132748, partial [Helobdella robusta]|uniref:C2H2-type domain-containing protein n=1 Tax=Helobdella robusta TaxID=6412 RepID=T1EHZ3_HELRO